MDERILKWLFDIQIAIDEIDGFFLGKERDFNEYKKNLMLKRAVERNLEIIGEAVIELLLGTIHLKVKYPMQKPLLV
jgi:uncharacterized protein with HEPN domain